MSKQLTLFGKPIRVNGYFKNPSSSYEHFINQQCKERSHSFATKQNFIDEARRNWKEMAPKEREDYIAAAPKKIEPKVKITSFFQPSSSNSTSVKADVVQRQPTNQPSTVSRSSSSTMNSLDIINNKESFLEQKKEAMWVNFFQLLTSQKMLYLSKK